MPIPQPTGTTTRFHVLYTGLWSTSFLHWSDIFSSRLPRVYKKTADNALSFPSAILDWFYARWDHPRRVLGGLCDCAKFGSNRCSNFDSMQILIFCNVKLENAYSRPRNRGFWGILPPKWGAVQTRPPKGTSLGGNTSYDV